MNKKLSHKKKSSHEPSIYVYIYIYYKGCRTVTHLFLMDYPVKKN